MSAAVGKAKRDPLVSCTPLSKAAKPTWTKKLTQLPSGKQCLGYLQSRVARDLLGKVFSFSIEEPPKELHPSV